MSQVLAAIQSSPVWAVFVQGVRAWTAQSHQVAHYLSAQLPKWSAPLAPVFEALNPHFELLKPHLKHAQPILDKIPRHEVVLVLAGLLFAVFSLQTIIFLLGSLSGKKGSFGRAYFSPVVFWLILSSVVHMWLEFNYVFARGPKDSGMYNAMNLYFAADFRYGEPLETGTASMETITALLVGPLCLLLAYAVVLQKSWRHPLQICVTTCQMYGLLWFIGHAWFDTKPAASDDPFLWWTIFFGLNLPWAIFPPLLWTQSFRVVNAALYAQEKAQQVVSQQSAKKNK